MVGISEQIEGARKSLLDLTMKNKLLNFKPTKARTIEIDDDDVGRIFYELVSEHKKLKFKAVEVEPSTDKLDIKRLADPTHAEEPKARINILKTKLDNETMEKRLIGISRQSKLFIEEQGYSILYLAIGFLEWKESPQSIESVKAPLVLVPVEIDRIRLGSIFKLSWTGEDIQTNISLKEKLLEFGIDLPDFDMPEENGDVTKYFKTVSKSIPQMQGWKVQNRAYLSFFSFTKFVMYKDLDPIGWPLYRRPENHEVLNSIFVPSQDSAPEWDFNEADIDSKFKSKDTFHVMDADPSQIAVLECVKQGGNIVVEGPPGTGKSQTIVNMIAELMSQGKTVLFVSEKMAALDVVKRRLDQVGLGDFCLELHSQKANKKNVIEELKRVVSKDKPRATNYDLNYYHLDRLKDELNKYVSELSQPCESIGLSPFQIINYREEASNYYDKIDRPMPKITFDHYNFESDEYEKLTASLADISQILQQFGRMEGNPWKDCEPGLVLPQDLSEIEEKINDTINSLDDFESQLQAFLESTGLEPVKNDDGLGEALAAARIIADYRTTEAALMNSPEWDSDNEEAESLIDRLKTLQKLKTRISSRMRRAIFEKDASSLASDYRRISSEGHAIFREPANRDIVPSLYRAEEDMAKLLSILSELTSITGTPMPLRLEDLHGTIDTINLVRSYKIADRAMLLNSDWNYGNNTAKLTIEKIESAQKLRTAISAKMRPGIIDQDVTPTIIMYKQFSSGFLKLIDPRYYKMRGIIQGYYLKAPPKEDSTLLSDLGEIEAYQNTKKELSTGESGSRALFGAFWDGDNSDAVRLREYYEWMLRFRGAFLKNLVTEKTVDAIAKGIADNRVERLLKDLDAQSRVVQDDLNHLFSFNGMGIDFSNFVASIDKFEAIVEDYQKLRSSLISYYNGEPPGDDETLLKDLLKVEEYKGIERSLIDDKEKAALLFGGAWHGPDSDPALLSELSGWLVRFRGIIRDSTAGVKTIQIISGQAPKEEMESATTSTETLYNKYCSALSSLTTLMGVKTDALENRLALGEIKKRLDLWEKGLKLLPLWSQYTGKREAIKGTIAAPMVDLIESDRISPEDLVYSFKGNLFDQLLRDTLQYCPTIGGFYGVTHQNLIAKFRELDRKILQFNQKRLYVKLYDTQPHNLESHGYEDQYRVLLKEFSHKVRHIPIRKLLSLSGPVVQKIKPCFMMSPLSIAQFLDHDSINFDVVIFDEASQVRPEEALGAILRGRQLVVIGDTHQLPPTSFFDRLADSEDDDEDSPDPMVKDVESIIHLCQFSFPTKMLKWHYRSKHESLIAVSNLEFYNKNLVIYPSPIYKSEELGLKYQPLLKTIYDRGRSGVNRDEAREVVKAAFKHFEKFPGKSLGIGTFNIRQQQAIEDELDLQLRQHPEMGEFFNRDRFDGFFIKNLETIQGDERDVIFISVGFGFDGDGKMSMNFGPLNQSGGERRLNVLITRAREKCVVFANFSYTNIQIGENSSQGLKALKTYMQYAETGTLESFEAPQEDTDSPFEQSVYEFLTEKGYEVKKQVGCAGFRVDLAIVDPMSKGNYLLGIECDGRKYHSSRVARERDRLRQQVLEELGWKIYRIWSTDWYKNRMETKKKLMEHVNNVTIINKFNSLGFK